MQIHPDEINVITKQNTNSLLVIYIMNVWFHINAYCLSYFNSNNVTLFFYTYIEVATLTTGNKRLRRHTWSSSGSSQKHGMYFAHSTRMSSWCFIDSQTSSSDANFLDGMLLVFRGGAICIRKHKERHVGNTDKTFIGNKDKGTSLTSFH